MLERRLLTVACASLLLLTEATGSKGLPDSTTTTYSVTLDHDDACLTEINVARKSAGLSDFIVAQSTEKAKRLPEASDTTTDNDPNWAWTPVCNYLLTKQATSGDGAGGKFGSGTYAFQVVDASIPSCNAVVDNWKKAYTNFNELPPPNKDGEQLYKKQENVSLVAIYNPSNEATADCRVVTCTKTVNPASKGAGLEEGEEDSKPVETKGFAVVCMTTPDVLSTSDSNAPFTEEQWGKIVSSIKGSASAILPTLLGLVAAFFGLVAAM